MSTYEEQLSAMSGYTEKMPGDQGSQLWAAERLGKATGSRFVDVMAVLKDRKKEAAARYKYKMELVVERITGEPYDHYVSPYMEHGTQYEESARIAYERRTGAMVMQPGFRNHPTIANCGGSFDGFPDEDGIIEIKCPTTFNHLETLLADAMPDEHKPQVQGYLWITGRKWCDFISYDPRLPHGLDLFVKRVPRDNDYIAELAANVIIFLGEVDELHKRLLAISDTAPQLRQPATSPAGAADAVPPLEL